MIMQPAGVCFHAMGMSACGLVLTFKGARFPDGRCNYAGDQVLALAEKIHSTQYLLSPTSLESFTAWDLPIRR